MPAEAAHRCGVIGDPVAHSLSPALHNAGYAAAGLEGWSYQAIRVEAGRVGDFLAGLGDQWRGLSVTAPHKREALALADTVTERAELAGGVNTLVRGGSGWVGDNTDLPGAVAAIRERYQGPAATGTILGGGATAASTGLALAYLGVETITLAVRDPERARDAAAAIAAHPARPRVDVVTLDQARPADIVVSTIPIAAQTPELTAAVLPAPVLFEVTYNTWPTPLVSAAERSGSVLVSGLDLLVHQAVLQFEQFTGSRAPLAAMREAGESALAARTD
ncbi:shikimate dehydrogenase [Nocardioides sp.]|uniref:shikimate dehydrogenase n=1 Tax=Nocardioides sp. TaxID=35761 RepID=UPI0026267236|nr:shikimate dehydrogenase [Nocardioides sp.]